MLRQRCPWCGEQLPLFIPFKYLPHSVKERIFKCPTCKKEYKIYQKHNKGNGTKRKWLDLFVLLFFIVFFVLLKVRWIYYPWWLYVVISLSVFAILFLYEASFTYMRSIDAFFRRGIRPSPDKRFALHGNRIAAAGCSARGCKYRMVKFSRPVFQVGLVPLSALKCA